ncbi:peptidoglycan D,D-transpeptidase FtsI family protein [Labrys neptuniae]
MSTDSMSIGPTSVDPVIDATSMDNPVGASSPDVAVSSNVASPAKAPRRRMTKLEKSAGRIVLIVVGFVCIYVAIMARLAQFGTTPDEQYDARRSAADQLAAARPDILDRNGRILATDVQVPSLYAEPKKIIDVDEATELLSAQMPDLDARELRTKLSSGKGFIWLKREITPEQRDRIYALGLPGVGFINENKRIYPNGPTVSHVLGAVNIDNQGIAGLEKYIDKKRSLSELQALGYASNSDSMKPVQTSIDLRAQAVMRDELVAGMEHFKAKAAGGVILDVTTGEVVSLVSLPDFNPNNPADALDPNRIDRITVGTYEMGSTFKALTLAMAIESGKFTTNSMLDARAGAITIGRWTIHDYHAQHRMLSLPEVFTYSSNIGVIRMMLGLGVPAHQAFLRQMGQLDRLVTELPENAAPIVPRRWGVLNSATIAFGQGINVAPLQAIMAVGAMMNGGHLMTPTFIKRTQEEALALSKPVLKQHTSDVMRYVMRLNATNGSAKKVDVFGYQVGGKTGTADKLVNGHYVKKGLNFTTFMAVFPFDKPRYLVTVLYDEPKGLPETYGYSTAAWNAGVTCGKLVERIGPLLGVKPRFMEVPNTVPPLNAPKDQLNQSMAWLTAR